MLISDPTLARDLKAGIANPMEVEKYLLNNFSAPALAHELAKYIVEDQASKPIVLTRQQLMAHVRIQGFRWSSDGELIPEARGNYSKKEK
jgi:hypothetical protein